MNRRKENIMRTGLLIVSVLIAASVSAQNVGIGADSFTPDASAILELRSTTSGLLVPRMTQAQKEAISSPAEGLLMYQTDNTPGFYYHDGSAWETFGAEAADDFGDHTAEENIHLNGNWLSGDGDEEGIFVDEDGNVGLMVGNPTAAFHTNGTVRHEHLAGVGNRMVVADAQGNLTSQPIPSMPTSRSSSSGQSINSNSYSSGNSVLSDITLEDMPAGTYIVQYSVVFSGASSGGFVINAGGSNVTASERQQSDGNVSGMAVVTLSSTGDIQLRGRKTSGGSGITVTHRTLTATLTN